MDNLTPRQQEILNYIAKEIKKKGYPPSIREIGQAVGLRSSSTVHAHLEKLQSLGYLRRDPTKPRALEVLWQEEETPGLPENIIPVPIVGRVTAGEPILAVENVEDYFPLPHNFTSYKDLFMLKVRGDSMTGAGIFDGDLVLVQKTPFAQNGDIVVALVENDEATVKRFFVDPGGKYRLEPENPSYSPLYPSSLIILGRVIGLVRKF
ncbi:MAG: transcriptional repressor LexA [Firmicutes bacterium]|nr:transcriptional repressor LexA [Bacillota bacterium]